MPQRIVYESSLLELFTTGVWLYLMNTSVVMIVRRIPRREKLTGSCLVMSIFIYLIREDFLCFLL